MTLDQLYDDFVYLDDWEDRYRYIIDLGRGLPPLAPALHVDALKVSGCASQVWIFTSVSASPQGPVLNFTGDSDALIVKGLMAIVFLIFSGQTAIEILARDAVPVFQRLGLSDHLTPQRANGLAAMVTRIKAEAQTALGP